VNYADLATLIVPEILVVVTAFVALIVDLAEMRHKPIRTRMFTAALITAVGCMVSIFWLSQTGVASRYYDGMLVIDPLNQLMKQIVLVMTIFTAFISIESNFTDHVGEYFFLVLLATVGMMFLVSSENLLMIFLALELLSLSLYILTAYNKQNIKSAEAALKYFLFGGMSAAFMLFGLSLVYGLSGEINLIRIKDKLLAPPLDPLLVVALVMVVIGFGFKVAAVPFHLWAPDAYQGAPAPSAAFIASGSKVASFFILAKVVMVGFFRQNGSGGWHNYLPGWVPLIAIVAALSILLGNLAAIAQTSVRRLLAYSAIAQAGYVLIGLLANNQQGIESLIFYITTYALTVLGAFGVVNIVQERAGHEKLSNFAGLAKRAPLLSFCMMIFMLSLAGIPPLAGFFGKFYLFASAVGAGKSMGLLWLVIFAVAMSAVSLYYYLQVLKQIYVTAAPVDAPAIHSTILTRMVIASLALAVLLLGCAPNFFLQRIIPAVKAVGF